MHTIVYAHTTQLEYGGWLKPIMIGYQGISDLYQAGEVANVRDRSIPSQFVESLYSLGQWISPHRITHLDQLMWSYSYDAEHSLYLCENKFVSEQHDPQNQNT